MKHPRWWTRELPQKEGFYFWKRNHNWSPWLWHCYYVTFEEERPTYWETGWAAGLAKAVYTPRGGHWSMIRPEALEDHQ